MPGTASWRRFSLSMFLCLVAVVAHAGDLTVFELVDGSTVRGRLTSFAAGVYTIDTGSLGTLRIPKDKVRAIASGPNVGREKTPTGPRVPADLSGPIAATQQQMLNDPALLERILSLRDDPAVRDVLDDPATLAAVQAADVGALLENPKFLKLLDNRALRDIQEKVAQ